METFKFLKLQSLGQEKGNDVSPQITISFELIYFDLNLKVMYVYIHYIHKGMYKYAIQDVKVGLSL
jgi:hypothetical protein